MIYVKRKSTSLLLALASLSVVSSSLVSCSESVGMSGVTLSDKKISFTATEVNGWTPNSGSSSNDETTRTMSTVDSYHPLIVKSDLGKPLYLHPVEQVGTYFYNDKDELVTRSGVPLSEINNQNSISTRGTKVTEIGDEIFVSAVSKKDNVEAGYFSFEKATKSGNIWHISNDEYWTTNASLSFYAYAPTNASMLSTSDSGLSGYRTVHYVAGTGDDIKSQPDFIVAKSEDNEHKATDTPNAVNLHFSHALTAITFAVGKDMVPGTISKITVRGVKGEGDYNIATNTWNTDNVTADAEYTIDKLGSNGDGTITGEKDVALTNNDQTLLMIPQTLGSDAEVEIVFDNDNGAKTLTASLSGTSWEAGHSIIYKLSASEVTTLNLGNIEFPINWSSQYTTTVNKLKSAYANGNQVGLFIVDDNNKLRNANVAVTYNSTSKTWSIPADKTCLFSPRFQYFAYYPYQENLIGMPTEGSTITISGNTKEEMATNFFSTAIENWQPASDQSDLDKLDKCDLQIGMANISNTASSIDFNTMSHAMSLAEVTLTTRNDCNCELYNDASYTWVGPVPASENFDTNKMFKVTNYEYTNNKFVAIVKPNTETEFSGGEKEYGVWSTTVPAIEANAIGYGSSILNLKQRFTLKPGDIYYSKGELTHQNEALVSDKTPIGVVGYIGSNYWTEKDTKAKGIGGHALVIGLKAIGSTGTTNQGTNFYWYPSNANASRTKVNGALIRGSSTQTYGSGYTETNALVSMSPAYAAAYQAKNYSTLPANSDKCTGWFLPTAGQYYAITSQLGGGINPDTWDINTFFKNAKTVSTNINTALSKVGANNYTEFFQGTVAWVWTSSEGSSTDAIIVDSGVDDNQGLGSFRFYFFPKSANSATVRPFLAF